MLNRRTWLHRALQAAAVVCLRTQPMFSQASTGILLQRAPGGPLPLPPDFIGLGYEKSAAAKAGLLRPDNARYVHLVGNLGRRGVLRIGGIVADFSHYEAQGQSKATAKDTRVTRADLEGFAAFLKTTGWTTVWSLNLGRDTLDDAVVEAKAVAAIFGSSLQAFELGNEVETTATDRRRCARRLTPTRCFTRSTCAGVRQFCRRCRALALPRRTRPAQSSGSNGWLPTRAAMCSC